MSFERLWAAGANGERFLSWNINLSYGDPLTGAKIDGSTGRMGDGAHESARSVKVKLKDGTTKELRRDDVAWAAPSE